MPHIEILDWGLIEYSKALSQQEDLLEEIYQQKSRGKIVLCSHPPVITLGRKTQEGDVFAWQGQVVEVSRGGRATYHGPSQVVVYPIIDLDHPESQFPKRDIAWYLRGLEMSIVQTLAKFGVKATGKKGVDETGVWVGDQKIASLGIGVRKWITFHGAAINFAHDPAAFQGLNPCGFSSSVMVSLEKLTGSQDREKFNKELVSQLQNQFLGTGAGVQELMY